VGASAAAEPGGRRRLAPEERRAQLLGVALRIFARRGLGQARHAEVAREAGVAVSTVFLYFPTREALVSAVLSEVERFFVDMSRRIHAGDGPPRELLVELSDAFIDSLESHRDHALVWLDWSTSFREETWGRYREFMERIVELTARTIERGRREGSIPSARDPHLSARLFIATAQMIAQMKLTGAGREELRRFGFSVIDATLGGSAS
jgi:TetR/AcrR family hemagglutinin/protease transcriptional regulator